MIKTQDRLLTFYKFRELFFQLVSRDIKLKYRRSILGYVWSVLNPLLTMIVLVIVFSNLFSRGIDNFPVYLLSGQLLFTSMQISTTRALTSVMDNASLLKKVYVPKYIFTLSAVTSELVTFFFSLGAFIIVFIATKAPLSWRIVFVVIPIVLQYLFCIGLGLFLAQAYVFFRDILYIWSVMTTAWLYLSAIFYPVTILPDTIQYLVTNFNPMYFYVTLFRNFTLGGSGSTAFVIKGAIAAGLALILGFTTFTYNKKKFILYI